MLDHYVHGDAHRISPEAPVPVVVFSGELYRPGGAANVAANLASIGVKVSLHGVIGTDHAGNRLKQVLEAEGIDTRHLVVCKDWPTIRKMRVLARNHQLLRLDFEEPLTDKAKELLRTSVRRTLAGKPSAVIVSDYAKGAIDNAVITLLRASGALLAADPKPSNTVDLHGFDILTPNHKEACELVKAAPGTDPHVLVPRLKERFAVNHLLVTLGADGMLLASAGSSQHIPTVAQTVYDVSGAGDTVIAVFVAAVAAGAAPLEAAVLANRAAGIVVGRVGTATVSPKDLIESA